ncbi:MAG: hypothetical protein KF850_26450 [Labilithrix sp.]|nr:hypothetical protein [Labilithrix sp.]MBX3215606.1 hypothetical protein [Labilithrix sp.]
MHGPACLRQRRSLIITSNPVFSEWNRIFKSPMTPAAGSTASSPHEAEGLLAKLAAEADADHE